MELLNKITMKGIGAQPKANTITSAVMLATIYGVSRSAKLGNTQYGDFVRFIGAFEAVNAETGETYQSGALILPGPIESLLHNAVQENMDNDGSGVQFAVAIGAKPAENNVGYEWTVKPLSKTTENDALAKLREEVKGLLPPPPAKSAKK